MKKKTIILVLFFLSFFINILLFILYRKAQMEKDDLKSYINIVEDEHEALIKRYENSKYKLDELEKLIKEKEGNVPKEQVAKK